MLTPLQREAILKSLKQSLPKQPKPLSMLDRLRIDGSEEQVHFIEMAAAGATYNQLQKEFSTSSSSVSEIKNLWRQRIDERIAERAPMLHPPGKKQKLPE